MSRPARKRTRAGGCVTAIQTVDTPHRIGVAGPRATSQMRLVDEQDWKQSLAIELFDVVADGEKHVPSSKSAPSITPASIEANCIVTSGQSP
jgi:hypothetical protein